MEKIHPVHLIEEPSYISLWEFEKAYDLDGWRKKAGQNWQIAVYVSAFYVALIFSLQRLMRDRAPFRLTKTLAGWNVFLAVFSTVAFCRTAPEFFHVLSSKNGFHNTVCKWTAHNRATAYWSWLLALSKLLELGDTIFVVLRKQNLLFLHWYHHITTFTTWWLMAESYEPNQLWYIVMNSFIHSFMYSYYALKALGFKIPRRIAMVITVGQIVQMAFGVIVNVYALNVMWLQGREADCNRGYFGLKVSFGIYVSYFYLFCHFFYKSYFGKKRNARNVATKSNGGGHVMSNGHNKNKNTSATGQELDMKNGQLKTGNGLGISDIQEQLKDFGASNGKKER